MEISQRVSREGADEEGQGQQGGKRGKREGERMHVCPDYNSNRNSGAKSFIFSHERFMNVHTRNCDFSLMIYGGSLREFKSLFISRCAGRQYLIRSFMLRRKGVVLCGAGREGVCSDVGGLGWGMAVGARRACQGISILRVLPAGFTWSSFMATSASRLIFIIRTI